MALRLQQDNIKTIIEAAIYLGNNLPRYESWDTIDINSPHRNLLPEDDKQQSADHLAKADSLEVNIDAKEASMDGFINDIITITVDNNYGIECAKRTALFFIHTPLRPLQEYEPLEYNDPLSLRKLAEGEGLVEGKTYLVWDIKSHYLRLFLTKDNYTSWVNHTKDA